MKTPRFLKGFGLFTLAVIVFLSTDTAWAIRLKIATLSPPSTLKPIQEGADQIAKETDNRVTFKFYYNAQKGSDKSVLKKIRLGSLHGCAVVSGSLSHFFPANQLYAQPMKFKTLDEIDYVRKHMDPFITNGLENNDKIGFVTFGLIGSGFSYIMSKNRIETVEDLRKQKVWIPDNDMISQESIKAFGISPIPLPISQVRPSLQTGLIDTVANSPIGAVVLQWHSKIKYVVDVPLIYLHAVLAINKKVFSKISEADREIVTRILSRASKEVEKQNRDSAIENINTLKKKGITFITPSPEAMKEWEAVGRTASLRMVETGVLPEKEAKEMDAHLKTFHETIGQGANAQ